MPTTGDITLNLKPDLNGYEVIYSHDGTRRERLGFINLQGALEFVTDLLEEKCQVIYLEERRILFANDPFSKEEE